MNRRHAILLLSSTALAGCASVQAKIDQLYVNMTVVAQKLEQAIKVGAKDMSAAIEIMKPYIVPACRLFLVIVSLAAQVATANPVIGSSAAFVAVLGQANILAANPMIQAAATNGAVPEDPVVVLTGIIAIAGQIHNLTAGQASPTRAAAAA